MAVAKGVTFNKPSKDRAGMLDLGKNAVFRFRDIPSHSEPCDVGWKNYRHALRLGDG